MPESFVSLGMTLFGTGWAALKSGNQMLGRK
jgi:hypothetical protein